jgi:phosphonoacetaldehyde dehydrogenase
VVTGSGTGTGIGTGALVAARGRHTDPPRQEGLRIGGQRVLRDSRIEVRYPYNGELVGTVARATPDDVREAFEVAGRFSSPLTRRQRYRLLMSARDAIAGARDDWARLITRESGLCLQDTWHEVDRACEVLLFAANEALVDDGRIFSCDVTEPARARKILTLREPLLGVVCAITPFNHPLNQVVHKVAPAVATNNRMVLKPSERTPLTALAFADVLYEAGLPHEMLQVVTGDPEEIGPALVTDPRAELVAFTGSGRIGRRIAATAGYRRLLLELGGNDPLVVLPDANLPAAAKHAAQGSYGNSGQRCTAVKRILVQDDIADRFADHLLAETERYRCGDPLDPATSVGTVIDEGAARAVEAAVDDAIRAGARLLHGGRRDGASYPPTVVGEVTPDLPLVTHETFGPVSPILRFTDVGDAIRIANSTRYALSAGVFTSRVDIATRFIRELHAGTVNIGEVPGFRLESTPFGGIKDSGLGGKEGVVEAMRAYTTVKTCSLPW